jgi:hypothetical protein
VCVCVCVCVCVWLDAGAGATQLVVTLQTIPRQPVRVYLSFADSSYLTLGGVLSDGDQRFLEWESADWDTPKTLLLQTFADNFFADVVRGPLSSRPSTVCISDCETCCRLFLAYAIGNSSPLETQHLQLPVACMSAVSPA